MGTSIETNVNDLIHRIRRKNHTEEEWFELEKEFNTLVKYLPKDLENKVIDSGAGEVLYMICSGIRFEQSKK